LPSPTYVPETPTPEYRIPKSFVSVLCQGCWGNEAIVWIGGTEQEPHLKFEVDTKEGQPATLLILWGDEESQIVEILVTSPLVEHPEEWDMIWWKGPKPDDYEIVTNKKIRVTVHPGETVDIDVQWIHWNQ
jgi:hypothetical protein